MEIEEIPNFTKTKTKKKIAKQILHGEQNFRLEYTGSKTKIHWPTSATE